MRLPERADPARVDERDLPQVGDHVAEAAPELLEDRSLEARRGGEVDLAARHDQQAVALGLEPDVEGDGQIMRIEHVCGSSRRGNWRGGATLSANRARMV